jgi:hypothetical protein
MMKQLTLIDLEVIPFIEALDLYYISCEGDILYLYV